MKVIKNNYKPEYPKQIVCTKSRCKSVLEYDEADIKKEKVKKYDQREQEDYTVTVTTIECPVCKEKIEV